MKKIFMTCLVFVLVACMCVTAFAEDTNGAFDESPSRNPAPELIGANNGCDNCAAQLVITAYADRDELSEEARKAIEDAYTAIVGAKELALLNAKLKELAEAKGVSPESLVVSDLFDISYVTTDGHTAHGHYEITLKTKTLKNFVTLLHYYEGEWLIVDGATTSSAAGYDYLTFSESKFSPFAIVVSTEDVKAETAPEGDKDEDKDDEEKPNAGLIIGITVPAALVVGGAGWFFASYYKKQKGGAPVEEEKSSSKKK